MAPATKHKVLVIGGQFSGGFTARELKKEFHVTVVDAKEFFEYTPGILRAFVKPAHFDALSFTLQPVYERKMGVKFIWGEVLNINGEGQGEKTAKIKPIYSPDGDFDIIRFHYCVICAGCNFGTGTWGESLWFPTIHQEARLASSWAHIDERFIEGRRRHILEEFDVLSSYHKKKAKILVVGAGFIGVEWATELDYYFPDCTITILDFLPRCLGPLPQEAAEYCSEYMNAAEINERYGVSWPRDDKRPPELWASIGLDGGVDREFSCIGVKASNYFMPDEVLSKMGPGANPKANPPVKGNWIHMNRYMQVTKQSDLEGEVWGDGVFFAVGDCNAGGIGGREGQWIIPPIPKISYPGEEQAMHACVNLRIKHHETHPTCCAALCAPKKMKPSWWPWGAGMFATSLGPHDACFVIDGGHAPGAGYMVNWYLPAAIQKEIIETTKVDEMKDNFIGIWIWHWVHHTPCNCFGKGPCFPCFNCPYC